MYYLKKDNKGASGVSKYMYVYCLLSDKDSFEGGGWMLVMANTNKNMMYSPCTIFLQC